MCQVPGQAFLSILMLGMPLANLLQAIPHQQLVIGSRKNRCGHVNEDTDLAIHGEGVLPEKDGGCNARTEATSQVGADAVAGEAPHHDGVGNADGEGDRDGGDERVGGVEAGPDDNANEAVQKEFLEEEVALVRLIGIREGAEDAGDAAVERSCTVRLQVEGLGSLNLGPVAAHEQQQAGDEGTEDPREDIVRHFVPGEALPDCKADSNDRIEVATGDGGAGDDSKSNADREGLADLEDGPEHRHAKFFTGGRGGG